MPLSSEARGRVATARPWLNGFTEVAQKRSDAEFELVDIKDFNLPLLDEAMPPIMGQYSKPHTKAWAAKIGTFDAYVFVTPEYNHGISGALKNAIDFLFAEWNNKAAGFVSYGGASGARAVEQLRLVLAEVQMATVRLQVLLSMYSDFENFSVFKPDSRKETSVNEMLDQLVAWGGALKPLRKNIRRHLMEIGVDSFVAATVDAAGRAVDPARHLSELLEAITLADEVGLDVFGIGEHHRREFLDSAPTMILAAAAARTRRIRLTSAVTVLSAADPVRVFQEFATLDLLSNGRAEIVAGRGSFIEAFPLFGLELEDYDSLFAEKLDLLLNIRENTHVHWSGKHRAPLTGQGVYPRPLQNPLPVWLGVGGTPSSFVRAGMLGLPLMVAIIGGEPHRFRPLIDRYREAGLRAGHSPDQLKVGIHSLGYVADSSTKAEDEFFPGYARSFSEIGRERGWPPVTRAHFDALLGPTGALLVGDPETVAEKILRVNESLGGISRLTFQMSVAALPHAKMLRAIELLGTDVAPMVRNSLASSQPQRVLPTVDRLAAANCAHSPTLTTQERIS